MLCFSINSQKISLKKTANIDFTIQGDFKGEEKNKYTKFRSTYRK